MRKRTYFASEWQEGWPKPAQIEHYFLNPPGRRWFFETGNDGARLVVEGLYQTESLEPYKSRIDADLMMTAHPELGVLLTYSKWGGNYSGTFNSKGDLRRLNEYVRSLHDTPMPAGLFVSYADAWKAVQEFIGSDGELPTSINWISSEDLPPGTFPDP